MSHCLHRSTKMPRYLLLPTIHSFAFISTITIFLQVDRRQSPDSTMTCRPREDHVTLSKDNWKAIKTHCRTGNYIMKAHMRWTQAERLHRQQSHEDFFARIPRICDVPQLKFFESSLMDLSMYQKAVVNELRDQYQSNHDS